MSITACTPATARASTTTTAAPTANTIYTYGINQTDIPKLNTTEDPTGKMPWIKWEGWFEPSQGVFQDDEKFPSGFNSFLLPIHARFGSTYHFTPPVPSTEKPKPGIPAR